MRTSGYGDSVAVPETDLARVRRWVDARNDRISPQATGQIRFEMECQRSLGHGA